jgi:hypothetical protein
LSACVSQPLAHRFCDPGAHCTGVGPERHEDVGGVEPVVSFQDVALDLIHEGFRIGLALVEGIFQQIAKRHHILRSKSKK